MYQICISPFLFRSCRFIPSCSNYTISAILKHGLFYGLYFSTKRILRCQPLCKKSGYDPIP